MALVVLGHFFQSMVSAGLLGPTAAYRYFIQFIYWFHVPLLFLCSGFLYQRYTKTDSVAAWARNAGKKFAAFSVPYFFFSTVSYLLKNIFSSYVNHETNGLLEHLFIRPAAPYWFLLTLFVLFVIIPTAKSKKMGLLMLAAAFCAWLFCNLADGIAIPSVLQTVLVYAFWFVLGMCLALFDSKRLFAPWTGILFLLSAGLAWLGLHFSLPVPVLSLCCGLLACFGLIGWMGWVYRANRQTPVMGFLAKYTMPVYLLHTIFSAGVRAVLFKAGINSAPIHIAAGLLASFVLPILAEIIMEKIHLDFLIYPLKYIRKRRKQAE